MAESAKNLGKLIYVHGTSPVFLQRAAIVAGVSFVFFLAMLIVFYTRPQIVYFVLATAFLVVNIFTMIGFLMQKRNVLKVYENGLRYKKTVAVWGEIAAANVDEITGLVIEKTNGERFVIRRSIDGLDKLATHIRGQILH